MGLAKKEKCFKVYLFGKH